ncbi:MAG: DNA polymerase, partial [bacterium]|nr:DNA polymerase [bacterium]
MKTLVLIDTNALIHRSFHALPPLTSPSGEIVNAVYGFTMVLMKMFKDLKPDYAAAAFDLPEPTFRHEEYKEYKATRKKAPEELYSQIPKVKEILTAFGIPIYEKAGFEADDVIGTIAFGAGKTNLKTIIVTGDLDTLQLVDDNTVVYTLRKGLSDSIIYDRQAVKEKFEGLVPEQMNDYKGLKGDPSDNIPGAPGIGEKTAIELVRHFGSIEKLYAALEKGEPLDFIRAGSKLASKLLEYKEQVLFSKKLVVIRRDAPIDFNLADCEVKRLDAQKIGALFRELGFYSLISRLAEFVGVSNGAKKHRLKIEEIKNKSDFDKACKILKNQKEVGINLETSGGNWREAELKGVLIMAEERIFYFPLRFAVFLKILLEDEQIKKFGYNLKFIREVLSRQKANLKGSDFDIMLAAYLLNPGERSYDLAKIVFRELGEELPTEPDSEKRAALSLFYGGRVPPSLKKKIREAGLERVLYEIEMPLIPVLARLERSGVKIDKARLLKLAADFEKKLKSLEEKIYKLAGTTFNINSPKQLGDILFNKLKIEISSEEKSAYPGASPAGVALRRSYGVKKIKKTPTGQISTRASELLKLRRAHPLINLILEFRELGKLKNTYIDVLPDLADSLTGRIYATFNQVGTATGRLSSDSPNLQNIPARGEWGKEIRKAFLAD